MNPAACPAPLDDRTLVEYWLDELSDDAEAAVDEHLLGCSHCSARLAGLVALAGALKESYRRGKVHAFVSEAFVRRLAGRGLRVREYRLPHNGSVNCTVTPEDDLVVSYLEAPLENVSRVDVVIHPPGLPAQVRQDVPFDPESGEIVMSSNMPQLRAMPTHRLRLELVAVDDKGRHVLGEYIFNHTAHEA